MVGCSTPKSHVGAYSALAGVSKRLAQLFLERWAGSPAAPAVWAQVAPLYPGVHAGSPDGSIRQWFPAPLRCRGWGGRALAWHLVLLCLPRQPWAEEGASCAWASLGDCASLTWADSVLALAGAARENGALSRGFASTKSRSWAWGLVFLGCNSRCLESQLGDDGEPPLVLG